MEIELSGAFELTDCVDSCNEYETRKHAQQTAPRGVVATRGDLPDSTVAQSATDSTLLTKVLTLCSTAPIVSRLWMLFSAAAAAAESHRSRIGHESYRTPRSPFHEPQNSKTRRSRSR